jgi:hypothetical protein
MSPRLTKKSTRDIERHYFEEFRKAYTMPDGTIEYADRPDVLVRGEQTTGIELTRFPAASSGANKDRSHSQEQEVSGQTIKIASNVFDRIIVYKPGFEDIREVWP